MKIHLIPGYPATSEFLRCRIAIIARIPGYIYPDISPDTIHQPAPARLPVALERTFAKSASISASTSAALGQVPRNALWYGRLLSKTDTDIEC